MKTALAAFAVVFISMIGVALLAVEAAIAVYTLAGGVL